MDEYINLSDSSERKQYYLILLQTLRMQILNQQGVFGIKLIL